MRGKGEQIKDMKLKLLLYQKKKYVYKKNLRRVQLTFE